MINDLNTVLRELLTTQVPDLVNDNQIGFLPPDQDWQSHLQTTLNVPLALNAYLFDLRQNRKLRSNQRQRTFANGLVQETPAPPRLDAHYLLTAWSLDSNVEERAEAETGLLYDSLAVLMENAPLNPGRIYPPGAPELAEIDEYIRQADLPTEVAPVEGHPKLAEFWGTMGNDQRWRPAIYLIVTLPVIRRPRPARTSFMVTTRITEYRRTGQPETAEIWIQIGGHVLDALNPATDTSDPIPVAGAWVRLETTAGDPLQTTTTNALGRFTFNGLQPGQFQLDWRAEGFPVPAAPREIDVPSPTGEYDLRFE